MNEEQIVPELIKKYGMETVFPFEKRRSDYAAYFSELLNPSTLKRKELLKELLDVLYSMRPQIIFYLQKDYPEELVEFTNHPPEELSELKNQPPEEIVKEFPEFYKKFSEFLDRKAEKFKTYFKEGDQGWGYGGLLHYLRIGYPDYNTNEAAKKLIKEKLDVLDVPKELREDLEKEFFKVWKLTQLFFLYLGDIVEKFEPNFVLLRAEALNIRNIKKEDMLRRLIEDMGFGRYFLMIDTAWAIQDMLNAFSIDKDIMQIGNYEVRLTRKRSEQTVITIAIHFYENGIEIGECNYSASDGMPLKINGKSFFNPEFKLEHGYHLIAVINEIIINLRKEIDRRQKMAISDNIDKLTKEGDYWELTKICKNEDLPENIRERAGLNTVDILANRGLSYDLDSMITNQWFSTKIKNAAKNKLEIAMINEIKNYVDCGACYSLIQMSKRKDIPEKISEMAEKGIDTACEKYIKLAVEDGWCDGLKNMANDSQVPVNIRKKAKIAINRYNKERRIAGEKQSTKE